MKSLRFLMVFVLAATSMACTPFSIKKLAGNYKGILTVRDNETIDENEVNAVVTFEGNRKSKIAVTSASRSFDIEITRTAPLKATLHSALFKKDILLNKIRHHCFVAFEDARNLGKDTGQICFEQSKKQAPVLSLDVSYDGGAQKISLILSTDGLFSLPALETPRAYTLNELRERVQTSSFDSKIEVEKLKLARLTAEGAAANLGPHVSANYALGFIGMVTFDPMSLLKSLGSFAPFLFPTNWFKAIEKSDLSRAEEQTQIILRADAVNMVESLVYNYLRDAALLKEMNVQQGIIADFQIKVASLVEAKLMPIESNWKLQGQLDTIQETIIATQSALSEDLYSIALAAGFNSHDAISDVTADAENLITQSLAQQIGTSNAFSTSSVLRSPELVQMEYLLKAAQMQEQERIWNWLDPSGDSAGAIGAGLPAYIEVGIINLKMVQDQRNQLVATLRSKAASAFKQLDSTLKTLNLIADFRAQQEKNIALITREFYEKDPVDLLTLLTALQDRFGAEVNYINARYGVLVDFSKRERMLMMGRYSDQPTQRHTQ